MAHPYYLPKITIPETSVINPRVDNEITRLINIEMYMSVQHMVNVLSMYTIDFLHESRAGIKKRHLVRYDEALDRIYNNRSL